MKIAAAYIRVSSDDQLEYSPDSQLKLIREHAQREGFHVPDEYVYADDGISGRSADKRPAFRLMVAQAKQDPAPFEVIYVWKFSRFARNQEEAILYKNLLRRRRISVRSISEPSSDSPFSSLIERIIEWMDEYYLINLSGEVRRGMKEKASRGEAMGTAPFGYRVKDKTFVPFPEEAETVLYIFSAFAAGDGMRKLARELGDKGIRTRRGNLPDNRFVKYILTNPVYIGKIRWSTEGHAHYSRANYNDENVMLVEGRHEPLISPELWTAVQGRLKAAEASEPKYVRRGSEVQMLKGLLRCGSCGGTLTLISTKSPSMQCHNYARGQCGVSHSITVSRAEEAVLEGLRQVIAERAFTFRPPASAKQTRPVRDWHRLITAEELKLRRAQEGYLSGLFTAEEFSAVRDELRGLIAKLKAAQVEDEARREPDPDPAAMEAKARSVLEVLESPEISGEAKNAALRSIIEKIVFHKTPRRFDFYFNP